MSWAGQGQPNILPSNGCRSDDHNNNNNSSGCSNPQQRHDNQNLVFVTEPRACDLADGVVRIEPCQTMDLPFRFFSSGNHDNNNNAMACTATNKQEQQQWLILSDRKAESNFGAESDDDDNNKKMKIKQNAVWQELHPTTSTSATGKETVIDGVSLARSREYGYKYEFDDSHHDDDHGDEEDEEERNELDQDDHRSANVQNPKAKPKTTTTTRKASSRLMSGRGKNSTTTLPPMIYYYILGKIYHPNYNADDRRDDESSLFWFTYRCDFYEIVPYRITTDAGWGCMLRSAQMLLGQALRLHYKGRDWKPPTSLALRRQDDFVRDILTWFADFPSTTICRFSLHNMVAAGMAKYEILPGEWYGPSTACYVLRDLVQIFEQQQQKQTTSKSSQNGCNRSNIFRVHVAGQGTVFRDEIHTLMTRNQAYKQQDEKQSAAGTSATVSSESTASVFHPLDPSYHHQTMPPVKKVDYNIEWDTSLLLLIPLRLGLKSFHSDYVQSLAFAFSLPQSVGVLGGRPRGARWFYGATSDGSRILGLDPHTIQCSPQLLSRPQRQTQLQVDLSDEYLQSVHTSFPEIFPLSKMDPSIALGFYCQNNAALEHLIQVFGQWKLDHPNLPELFTVAETTPDYMAVAAGSSSSWSDNNNSGMLDSSVQKTISLLDDMAVGDEDDDEGDIADEDSHASDEYVIL